MTQAAPAFNPAAGPQWPRVLRETPDRWYLLPGENPAHYGLHGGSEPVALVRVTCTPVNPAHKPLVVWLEAEPDSDPQDACLYHRYQT